MIQLNPSFPPGATIDDLVAEGVLALAFARPAGLQMGRTVTLQLTTPADDTSRTGWLTAGGA